MSKAPFNKSMFLFGATFASAFLLFFGLGMLAMTFFPALAALRAYEPRGEYTLLPASEDREEEFIDVESLAGKQLFPPLPDVSSVEKGDWIRVPSIGVNVPLALSPSLKDEDVIATLVNGVALYPNGIIPGRLGNVFIAAHSTGNPWHGVYRFAFLKINEVQPGNVIHLDY